MVLCWQMFPCSGVVCIVNLALYITVVVVAGVGECYAVFMHSGCVVA